MGSWCLCMCVPKVGGGEWCVCVRVCVLEVGGCGHGVCVCVTMVRARVCWRCEGVGITVRARCAQLLGFTRARRRKLRGSGAQGTTRLIDTATLFQSQHER